MNIWRKFESEQAFADWHEQSKQLLNMPIVGVRASDGVPQPDKQQTTDYTALTYQNLELDSDGEPIIPAEPPLDAVVADESIIEQVSVLVRADMMLPEELAELANVYPAWQPDEDVVSGDLRSFDNMLWKVIDGKSHTTQSDWTPSVARSLWVRTAPPDVIPEWIAPTGAHDAYPLNYQVTYNGDLYQSKIDANVWVPGSDPSLWELIGGSEPEIPNWVQPTGGHNAYNIDDEVKHDNPNDGGNIWVYRSKINANTTEPGRDGTFDRWWEPVRLA